MGTVVATLVVTVPAAASTGATTPGASGLDFPALLAILVGLAALVQSA